MCSKCSQYTPWGDGICDSCFWKSGPIFPAGITINPRCVATCTLRGHGTTVAGFDTRWIARHLLGLRDEASLDYWSTVGHQPSRPALVAAMGAELVRRLRERTCNEPG